MDPLLAVAKWLGLVPEIRVSSEMERQLSGMEATVSGLHKRLDVAEARVNRLIDRATLHGGTWRGGN